MTISLSYCQNRHIEDSSQVIKIPVIFNNIYFLDTEKISIADIEVQLQQLNRDFLLENDTTEVLDSFQNKVGKANIQFYLAKNTNSINYKRSDVAVFGNNDIYFDSLGGFSPVFPERYLNIWVTNLLPGISGWAKNVFQDSLLEGVVIDYNYFGNSSISTRNMGRTLVHEVGHWLGLSHTWEIGCGIGDGINDTPNQENASSGCDLNKTSCSSLDMVQNFMDYSDDNCRLFFTQGQVDSMRFFILENKQDLITEGANLGVSTSLKNKIVLYPTPTHNQLNIESQTHFNQLNIYNSIGVLVLNKRFTPRKTLQIDLTYLNSAFYFLNIQDNEQILSKKKFIKN